MLPNSFEVVTPENSPDGFEIRPSYTYRMDFVNKRIDGKTDGIEAVYQFVRKVLDTDKYAWEIYDWYYGNELLSLVGKSYDFCVADIPRICREALLTDDRIVSVGDFTFNQINVDSMEASFRVKSIFGVFEYRLEVQI